MTRIKKTPGRGFAAPDEQPKAYVALKQLRWGDGWLEPGDEVPIEPGRRYGAMVRHGQISQLLEAAGEKPKGGRR
jgi:hypothetical protein